MKIADHDIFINCPFDEAYASMFRAILFAVIRCGYRARCALETDNAGDTRFTKICSIVEQCKFGIHDISRTEADGSPPLPRFNMPLELGLFLGAQRFGGRAQKGKSCIVFDRERYRFQRFISDIAGQDIHSHEGKVDALTRELTAWLRSLPGGDNVGGGQAVADEYAVFEAILPDICHVRRIELSELTFFEYNEIIPEYISRL